LVIRLQLGDVHQFADEALMIGFGLLAADEALMIGFGLLAKHAS
jgi:hypothetical protein